MAPPVGTPLAYLVSSEIEKYSQTGDLQVSLNRFERETKTSKGVEISLVLPILEVDEVQPSNNGVTDSDGDDDGDSEAINIINNT